MAEHTDRQLQDEIRRVFERQRANRITLKKSTADQRRARLRRLREVVAKYAEEADAALFADLGKPRMGAEHFEVTAVYADIDEAIACLDDWMASEPIEPSPTFAGNDTYVLYEPRGVVLLFGPWNFPFALTLVPLVPIIAAGNCAMVKPNELQPRTSQVIARIIREAFDESEVAVFEGGVSVAEALQDLPFDHVFFTGSPAVGKRVMAAAARHLSSVTLELGGKCPAIVDDDYPMADFAAKSVFARFLNDGQLCLSVDYVCVPRARESELVSELTAAIERSYYVDGEYQAAGMAHIVDARNLARIRSWVDEAVAGGARIVCGGTEDESRLIYHPTVLADAPLTSRIMTEEIFGPVLPVLVYDSLDDVARHVDATGKPLALYVFSHDPAFVDEVLALTSSGGVTVNNVLMHTAEARLPFGGVNGSGMGRYKSRAGFRELSNARSVFAQKS